ncbi:hypothetical protein SDC9_103354 [bioreactor metagenome]|uniref:Uncharacterized protein n=1 Tax=bioreactor metagenome TaxID=1076179 RepID=A0A645AUV2_9ZZZZ
MHIHIIVQAAGQGDGSVRVKTLVAERNLHSRLPHAPVRIQVCFSGQMAEPGGEQSVMIFFRHAPIVFRGIIPECVLLFGFQFFGSPLIEKRQSPFVDDIDENQSRILFP